MIVAGLDDAIEVLVLNALEVMKVVLEVKVEVAVLVAKVKVVVEHEVDVATTMGGSEDRLPALKMLEMKLAAEPEGEAAT